MRDLTNLLKETVSLLEENKRSESEILYVSASYYSKNEDYTTSFLSWEDFKFMASEIDYNSGHGTHYINLQLKVIGHDFWLERTEYDGAEGWSYKALPIKPEHQLKPTDKAAMAIVFDRYSRYGYRADEDSSGIYDNSNVNLNDLEEKILSYKEKENIEKEIEPAKNSIPTVSKKI